VFQDVEADVQAEFERHAQFALDLARSADDPSDPESYQGREAPNFEVSSFDVSYGSPQTVQVNARRDLGRVWLKYRINNGREHTGWTWEWRGGDNTVKVWFVSRHKRSSSFTYTLQSDTNARVLILAAEDYTGSSQLPNYASTTAPNSLSYYENALRANGISYAVYDIDAMGRKAPDTLGVLGHFDAVIWYTGNDNVTRTTSSSTGWGRTSGPTRAVSPRTARCSGSWASATRSRASPARSTGPTRHRTRPTRPISGRRRT
jgi:hypothetical protein